MLKRAFVRYLSVKNKCQRFDVENFRQARWLSTTSHYRAGHGKHWTDYDEETVNVRQFQDQIMHRNREIAIVPPERHRSEWPNWNYDAEIFAFCHRIGETFDDALLRKALQDSSMQRLSESIGIGGSRSNVGSGDGEEVVSRSEVDANDDLAELGRNVAAEYIHAYIGTHFPNLMQEGCEAVSAYLLNDTVSSHVARNLGIADLILSDSVKPLPRVVAKAFHAIIGALTLSTTLERAQHFVLDFLLTQLVEKDIFELIDSSAMNFDLLKRILFLSSGATLEPRLIRSTASSTILSLYTVGIYSDKDPNISEETEVTDQSPSKTLVGEGSGETVAVAVDMAAKDGLRRIFGTHWGCRTLLGDEARNVRFQKNEETWSLASLPQS